MVSDEVRKWLETVDISLLVVDNLFDSDKERSKQSLAQARQMLYRALTAIDDSEETKDASANT